MRNSGADAHARSGGGSRKVVLAALGGNLAIAATKFVAWAFTGSAAMLTEGIHSLVDTGDQVLLLVGQVRAARPPSDTHPFGYGMETYFWSFIVALMIFLAGGVVAVWEGVERMLHPEPMTHPLVSFAVLGASAFFEGLSFRTAYREFRQVVRGRDVRLVRFLRLSKDPNVFATLLEDGAALTGLAIAAAGIAAASLAGVQWADGAASALIGLLLLGVALFLANETRSLIAGEAAAPAIETAVREALQRCPELGELVGVRTLHLGPETILVAVRWRLARREDGEDVAASLSALSARVKAADPRIADVVFDVPAAPEVSSGASRSAAADTVPPDRRARPPARRG